MDTVEKALVDLNSDWQFLMAGHVGIYDIFNVKHGYTVKRLCNIPWKHFVDCGDRVTIYVYPENEMETE